jgi:probable HAF family extracellular repeat protein
VQFANPFGGGTTIPVSINDDGIVVGWGTRPEEDALVSGSASRFPSTGHGFIYDSKTGSFNTAFNTPAGTWSAAWGINNKGQVVGWIGTGWMQNDAFLFSDNQLYYIKNLLDPADPQSAGVQLDAAVGINDAGQIVVNGRIKGDPRQRAFL